MKGERMQPRGAPLLCTKMLDKQFLTDFLGSVQEEVKDQKADWLGETKCQEFTKEFLHDTDVGGGAVIHKKGDMSRS